MDYKPEVAAMKSVYDIIMKLRNTSGSNAKKDILEFNKNNVELKTFLYHVYEPQISYYQTKIKPFNNIGAGVLDLTYDMIDEIIATLADRQLTGNAAVLYLGGNYSCLREDWMRELLQMLIGRDVKAGISVGTINKIWKKMLTDEPYMRCSQLKDVKIELWPWSRGIDSEIKYDSTYANIFVGVRDTSFDAVKSRNGSVYLVDPFKAVLYELHLAVQEFIKHYPQFANEEYIVFNGELEMLDPKGNLMPRAEGNGKFNSLLQKGEIPNGHTAQYKTWDIVPGSKFEGGRFDMPRRQRRAALALSIVPKSGVVEIAECTTVYSYEGARKHFKAVRARKLEGTILKHPDGSWEDTTSSHQVKMKNETMIEVEWVKLNPGSGKNTSTFGSVTFKSRDHFFEVDVTGFSDDARLELYNKRDQMPGTIHTIIVNELTQPKKAGQKWSAFLPRYDYERLDKNRADSLDEIIKIYESTMKDDD